MASTIDSVAVVGGGFMGAGIAEVVAVAGLPVVVRDVDERCLERARDQIETALARGVSRGKIEPERARDARERIELSTDLATLDGARSAPRATTSSSATSTRLRRCSSGWWRAAGSGASRGAGSTSMSRGVRSARLAVGLCSPS